MFPVYWTEEEADEYGEVRKVFNVLYPDMPSEGESAVMVTPTPDWYAEGVDGQLGNKGETVCGYRVYWNEDGYNSFTVKAVPSSDYEKGVEVDIYLYKNNLPE